VSKYGKENAMYTYLDQIGRQEFTRQHFDQYLKHQKELAWLENLETRIFLSSTATNLMSGLNPGWRLSRQLSSLPRW
jgi:hypothetical protein